MEFPNYTLLRSVVSSGYSLYLFATKRLCENFLKIHGNLSVKEIDYFVVSPRNDVTIKAKRMPFLSLTRI